MSWKSHCKSTLLLCLFLSLLLLTNATIAKDDIDEVAVRTWLLEANGEVPLPELSDETLAVPWLKERPSFGIAFSGGGTRSATATLGQLRALDKLGWLDKARHVSSNSGSSWTVVPFTYLPLAIEQSRFLGQYVTPAFLSDDVLRPLTEDSLAMGTAIHSASAIDEIHEIGRGDEAYSDIVGSIFLEPFGLHDNEKFFTFHRGALTSVLAANAHMSSENFQVVEREDRPYLVLTGVLLAQQMSEDPDEYFPLEMTPLYTGVRGRFEFEKDGEIVVVGGGYVESFGYDSYEPQGRQTDGRWQVRITGLLSRGDKPFGDRYRFTLSDIIGTTSAAPLATLSRNFVPNFLFPEFRHWSVDRDAINESGDDVRRQSDEFQHGDGSDMDNLSVTSLIARKTENIVAFVNTRAIFEQPEAGCRNVSDANITDDIISLFRKNGRLVNNVVFDDGNAKLESLCDAFAERRAAGEPLVHCDTYDVVENRWYRIEPYRPNVCWVYLDRVNGWMEQLDPSNGDLVRDLINRSGSFDNFPHYSTFAEQGISLIDLNRERVVALSNLTAWTVFESAEYIAENLVDVSLPAK